MINAALQAADPAAAVRSHLRREDHTLSLGPAERAYHYDLRRGRVFIVAAGKAALPMAHATLEQLQGEIAGGVIIGKQSKPGVPRSYRAQVGRRGTTVIFFEAGHPVPDESSVRASIAVTDLLEKSDADDLVLCLLSGGASALLTRPQLPLAEWQQLTNALLASGCTIDELNAVRKQLDQIKGGGLARLAAPSAVVSLLLSDVVGNRLDVIASGPTAPNRSSPAEALTVLHRYQIAERVPPESWDLIAYHLTNVRTATSLTRFERMEVINIIVADVRTAAEAAVEAARSSGWETQLLTVHLEGEAREVGRVAAAIGRDLEPGRCLVLGGETTVTVRGEGSGGRNQELALSMALHLEDAHDHEPPAKKRVVAATFATDGEDGETGAAGAVVSNRTATQARKAALDPQIFLDANDSHTFFRTLEERTGERFLLRSGSTGTNVNDLLFIFRYSD
ncbi:MAG: DUF4147 domain-containing protein [Candidatus Promineifilaceae bacterium]|nr:DUF4147 domain-containing protein [Candidatus Promineifilaceae bacterium]